MQEPEKITEYIELDVHGISYESDVPLMLPRESTATIMAPWITLEGPEYGLICAHCYGNDPFNSDGPMYEICIRELFIEHLKDCRVKPLYVGPYSRHDVWNTPKRLRLRGV